MTVKLLTEHDLWFLCLKGGCTGSCESTLVKTPHCWKSHVAAQMWFVISADTCKDVFNLFGAVSICLSKILIKSIVKWVSALVN